MCERDIVTERESECSGQRARAGVIEVDRSRSSGGREDESERVRERIK